MLGSPSYPPATFSTEVLACSTEMGGGDGKRSRGPLPRHPADGVITQLQLLKYIDMACNVADIH